MFKYTLDNKRYHTLNYHFKTKYNKKVFKVSLNAGFSCPNYKTGGCTFCLGSSGAFGGDPKDTLIKQFDTIKKVMERKWPNAGYIAYFQAATNTYAPLNVLKEKYETVLNIPNVIGLSIGTRPDAIESDVYDYLEELSKKTNLTIELGLQTIHNKTLKLINRGHSLKCFEDSLKELKKRGIEVVVHIINGLPGETKEDMINTVKYLNTLGIDGIKIHMLSILKGTKMGNDYLNKPFKTLTRDEYIDIVTEQLSYLDPKIVIHRITGDPDPKDLIEPSWITNKITIINDIDKLMVKKDYYQGCNLK